MTSYMQTGLMWLLFNILLFFTGVSGDESSVYSSVGDTARLPCNHSGSLKCSSILWGIDNQKSRSLIELVTDGKVKKENEKEPGKLKVDYDCSLHINNLTTADTGHYLCRLYHSESSYTDAPRISLSLLSISSSPPLTELKIGSTVTLHCKLHIHTPCRDSMRVTWVSETGNPLQGARYKVSETQCSSSLTLTLERSDRNMKWRCQLTEGEEEKASLSYTTSFPGVSGDESSVYSSVGDTARLPCNHSGSLKCSSPMWGYHNQTSGTNIELVIEGKVKKENEKEPGKLKVGSDCSLHINNLTTADTGHYFCRLNRDGSGHTDAIRISLSLLSISSSPPLTELKIGSTVTLHCKLHSHGPCRDSMRVTWVSETGNPLQGARYKVSETQCSSSLTLTLERSDRNMKWRCQLTEGEEQKASLSYTPSFPDENMMGVWIGSGVAICIAVVLLVILAVKYKRRKVERETAFTQDSRSDTVTDQNKGQSEDTVTYAVVNPSAAGKRKPGRETAETEYATIITSR